MATGRACAVTLAAVCAAASITLAAQQRFRAGVDLVHFSVVVTDRQGAPITGLKAEDFELVEEGTPELLYREPRTAFAATFLGSANVLEGRAVGDGRTVDVGPMRLEVGSWAPPLDGRTGGAPAWVVARPELLAVSPEPVEHGHRARLVDAVFLGATTRLRLRLEGGQEVRATVARAPEGTDLGTPP